MCPYPLSGDTASECTCLQWSLLTFSRNLKNNFDYYIDSFVLTIILKAKSYDDLPTSLRDEIVYTLSYWYTLNPTSYGISDSVAATGGRGVLEPLPPLRYHGRSHFGLCIAIQHLLPGIYRGRMPKFRLKSQKLNEILRFENFEIFPFVDTWKLA